MRVEERTAELQKLHNEKNRFISRASHDLRTPIAAIIGFSKLLTMGKWGELNNEQQERLTKIEDHAQRLTKIVSNLLSISRIEAGVIGGAKDKIYLGSEIENVIDDIKDLISQKSQKIIFKNHTNGMKAIGDKDSFHQALTNLLDNASKYSDANTEITLSAKIIDSMCKIDIKDQGMGLEKEDQKYIFNEFYRAKKGGELQEHGTGLGLAIVKKLIHQMNGTLSVSSKGLLHGSVFSITLPLAERE